MGKMIKGNELAELHKYPNWQEKQRVIWERLDQEWHTWSKTPEGTWAILRNDTTARPPTKRNITGTEILEQLKAHYGD